MTLAFATAALAYTAIACAAACTPRAGRERLGDDLYGQARFRDALTEYRAAAQGDPDARLWAKVGAAALHAGELTRASDAYLRLAGEDPTRSGEAAEGLEAVARAAVRSSAEEALRAAVVGLQAIAPERSVGGYALALARQPGIQGEDLVSLLPSAIAAAPDGNTVDSLLSVYGAALRETGGCDPAVPVFRAALRRSEDHDIRTQAGAGLAACAIALGDRARAAGDSEAAGQWFDEVMRLATAPDSERAAAARRLSELGVTDSAGDSTRAGEL